MVRNRPNILSRRHSELCFMASVQFPIAVVPCCVRGYSPHQSCHLRWLDTCRNVIKHLCASPIKSTYPWSFVHRPLPWSLPYPKHELCPAPQAQMYNKYTTACSPHSPKHDAACHGEHHCTCTKVQYMYGSVLYLRRCHMTQMPCLCILTCERM